MAIIDSNLFKLNIQKLFLSGRIDKAYERMYNLAEKLAVHEMKIYQSKVTSIVLYPKEGKERHSQDVLNMITNYRQKRLQHHIDEMKELLKLREEIKDKT